MKRHKIWYKRELFKKHFKSYQDWDEFNPPSGDKHPDRYKTDALQCKNPECPREGMLISEHESFYYFAKQISSMERCGPQGPIRDYLASASMLCGHLILDSISF